MELNQFLKECESYLNDLSITQKSKILSELSDELSGKNLSELKPKQVTQEIRIQKNLGLFTKENSPSFFKFLIKSFIALFAIFVIFISFLIWKFSPLMKIDEENQKIIFLGGLIDIDAKAGKFKVGNDYHFEKAYYKNEFQAEIPMEGELDEVVLDFTSGHYELSNSENESFRIKCLLEQAPTDKIINQSQKEISIDLTKLQGSCELFIPVGKKISVTSKDAQIKLNEVEFHSYIDCDNGNIIINENSEIDYSYDLQLSSGRKDEFQSSQESSGYEIHIQLKNGQITR